MVTALKARAVPVDPWNKKLAVIREKRKANEPIWFQRPPFHDPKFKGIDPKWHLVTNRERDGEEGFTYTWTALCGYRHKFWELLSDVPRLKLGKTPPKKAERCTKCEGKK